MDNVEYPSISCLKLPRTSVALDAAVRSDCGGFRDQLKVAEYSTTPEVVNVENIARKKGERNISLLNQR